MDYKILMDISGDLDPVARQDNAVQFIPMEYSLGDEMHMASAPESREVLHAFYDSQRKGDLTHTSQIAPYLYESYVKPLMEQGFSVLCLCLSGGLSSTFSSANIAKISLEEKYPGLKFLPVDTRAASGGMGVLAERAVRNRKAGMTIEENYEDLTAAAGKIRHWFLVQDLQYLKRGGRISPATAAIATVLNIKPILTIDPEGHLDTIAKARGNHQAVNDIVRRFEETFDPSTGDVIYVIDADDQEIGDEIEERVRALYPDHVIRRSVLSPIIGAHTGPGMAAICHMGKNS